MSAVSTPATGVRDYTMVGWGDQPESCEKMGVSDVSVCRCGNCVASPTSCNERPCPVCGSRVLATNAGKLAAQIQMARSDRPDGPERRVIGGVLRHPDVDPSNAREFHSEAGQVAKKLGWTGVAVVCHLWSLTPKAERLDRPRTEIWEMLRGYYPDPIDAWEAGMIEYDPHFQFIGLCENHGTQAPGDWRFSADRNFRPLRNNLEESTAEIFRYCRYLLDHAAFECDASKLMVRRYGDLAPQSFNSIKAEMADPEIVRHRRVAQKIAGVQLHYDDEIGEDDDPRICPECEEHELEPVVAADWIDDDEEWWEEADPYTRMVFRRMREIVYGRRRLPPGQRYFDSLDGLIEAIDAQSRREELKPHVEIETPDEAGTDNQEYMGGFV